MNNLECKCGFPLHWNYLRGTFECDRCQRVFQFHAGQLILMKAPRKSVCHPASGG